MGEEKDKIEELIEASKPVLAKIGFGSIMGYCSGMALQKVGKAVAFVVGMGFIALQSAASMGYIQIDWKKVQLSIKTNVDTNDDGSLNADDLKEYWKRFKRIMSNKLPDAGGFTLGFLYGVRYG